MLARFFANRPVFAWVLSIAIMLAGISSILVLPVAQYPDVAPPSVGISANYLGASAETVENSVTQVIEQQLTGIDGLLYFTSNSTSTGQANITVTFQQGTDPDVAQVQVQNKVQQAIPRLPSQVQQQGITVAIPRDLRNPDEDQAINKESSVIVSVPKDGDYYMGKKKVSLDDLKTAVEKALANKKEEDKIVYIKSGVDVSYGEVVKVINAVREKGVDKIGLVADKKKGKGAAPAPAA